MMDLCDNIKTSFNDTLHLRYIESSILETKCQCYIDGTVSVTLNDVRLNIKQLNACSSASLKINSIKFQCKKKKPDLGSIFQRKILSNDPYVYILLTLNSASSPAMVWLKIEPTGNLIVLILTFEFPLASNCLY